MGTSPRDSLITLQVLFKGLDGNPADVTDPVVTLYRDDRPVSLEVLSTTIAPGTQSSYILLPLSPPQTGRYKFSFLTSRMQAGLYNITFNGTLTDSEGNLHGMQVNGQIAIGEISRLQDWISRVSQQLMDDFPQDYRLDEPVHQWQPDQIYNYLRTALDFLNNAGPKATTYEFDNLPVTLDGFMVIGGVIWALYARARFEKANEMNYSDLHSLNIQRADFYKSLADTMYKDWLEAVVAWKKATPPAPIGLASQRLPFRIFRVIGMLPNYQSFFSG